MTKPKLPQVTLCAVDARCPALAAQALQRSMLQADFARVVLFTHAYAERPSGIEVLDIGPVRSGAEYSHFILRGLPAHVLTSHVLVTQWDGFVLDGSRWSSEFLQHDYIGAVWHDQPAAHCVGNGGFSLRSQTLLRAGLDARIEHEHPEDLMLGVRYRELLQAEYGLRFAPPELARQFAFENESPLEPTFGFHGPKNLPTALDAATLAAWIGVLPDDFFRGRDARRLARALLRRRWPQLAQQLVQRRRAAGRNDWRTRLLGAAAVLLGPFASNEANEANEANVPDQGR